MSICSVRSLSPMVHSPPPPPRSPCTAEHIIRQSNTKPKTKNKISRHISTDLPKKPKKKKDNMYDGLCVDTIKMMSGAPPFPPTLTPQYPTPVCKLGYVAYLHTFFSRVGRLTLNPQTRFQNKIRSIGDHRQGGGEEGETCARPAAGKKVKYVLSFLGSAGHT